MVTIVKLHPTLKGEYILEGEAHLIKDSAFIDYSGGILLKTHSSIGERTMIYTHTHRYKEQYWQDLPPSEGVIATPLVIEKYAYIGAGVIVIAGVKRIGEFSFIGAGSVLTHEVPDMELWVGNPARKIRDIIPRKS